MLVRLEKCEASFVGNVKCRPLRFTVELKDHKRQILKTNSLLRERRKDLLFSNIYFMPGPEVINLFSCSTQLSMKLKMLISIKI